MKLIISLLLATSVFAGEHLHIPLELTFEESQQWYENQLKHESLQKNLAFKKKEPFVQESINAGEKMSKWLKKLNEQRTADNQIRLTSKTSRGGGIPIDKPSIYGPSTIARDYKKLEQTMPKELWNVFYGKSPIGTTLPVAEDVFVKWARQTSRLYQTAVRWNGSKRWLSHYAARKIRDVRGYYYLKNLKDLDYQLENIRTLSQEASDKLTDAMKGICINARGSERGCDRDIKRALKSNSLKNLKERFWSGAVNNWNRFFEIPNPRKDVSWSARNPNTMTVTFVEPKNTEVKNWLKDNIEDEFQRPLFNWNLEMRFVPKRPFMNTAYLEFQPNVTPHVTGGNIIVMDANTPLEEYSVKWTIRHEYGHILRIPDCYHEFYDEEKNLMINYQLDVTDLMCSRAGDMNDRLYYELKDKYFKK